MPEMDLDEPSKHASIELFIGFCNVALQRAMRERMTKWGGEYIDPKNWTEPRTEMNAPWVIASFVCLVVNLVSIN